MLSVVQLNVSHLNFMFPNDFKLLAGFFLCVIFIIAACYFMSPLTLNYVAPPTHYKRETDEKTVSNAVHKKAVTTYFWVGEKPDESNSFISNSKSAWDEAWLSHYGGVDDPEKRCGFKPCGFVPKENPFYFALPYNDLDDLGERKLSAKNIPWYSHEKDSGKISLLKNRWIEIEHKGKTCYAQWEDVGPLETDDFEYVFGNNGTPRNTFGMKAGLDVSPAGRDCLELTGNGEVLWRFVEAQEVPQGAWKEIVTRDYY